MGEISNPHFFNAFFVAPENTTAAAGGFLFFGAFFRARAPPFFG
jgi:hypothetical protein